MSIQKKRKGSYSTGDFGPHESKRSKYIPTSTSNSLLLAFHLRGGDPMSVTGDAGVLGAVGIGGRLSRQQIPMFVDAVSLVPRDLLILAGNVLRARPGQVISPDLHVIVGELTQLVVIQPHELRLVRRAEMQPGDVVDGQREEIGDQKRPPGGGEDEGNLDVELLESPVNPPANEVAVVIREPGVDAVQPDNVIRGEDRVEQQTHNPGDAVFRQNVHGVVNSEQKFD